MYDTPTRRRPEPEAAPPCERRGPLGDRRALGSDRRAHGVQALLHTTLALVLAGGRGSRLRELTAYRAKPDMPFAGKLKIIDFALSNCLNSGIRRVAVLTQYRAQSLIRHVTRGFARLDAAPGEFVDVVPAQQQNGESWYAGTADAVAQNADLIREAGARWVLVPAGAHVYKMA